MLTRIKQLRNHCNVCGIGNTGRYAVAELLKNNTPFVVIEHLEDNIKRLQEQHGGTYKDMLYIIGDATDEEVLESAGVNVATGLLTMLPQDKENLGVSVMVREKNCGDRGYALDRDRKYSKRMR